MWDISYHLELDTSAIGATCRSIYSTVFICVYEKSSCVFGWKCLHPNGDRGSRRTRTETHHNRVRSFVVDTSRLRARHCDVVTWYRYHIVWLCLCTPSTCVRVGVRDGLELMEVMALDIPPCTWSTSSCMEVQHHKGWCDVPMKKNVGIDAKKRISEKSSLFA
jgi:hypothetical protein